jgi:uracil-DNA glycosylase
MTTSAPLQKLTQTIVTCRRCRDDGLPLTDQWMPPRGWAGNPSLGERTFMFVTINPGLPLIAKGGAPVEEGYWSAFGIVEGMPDPTRAADALATLCTSIYEHVDGVPDALPMGFTHIAGKDLVFHKRCMSVLRACMAIAGAPWDGDWKQHCWMTDLVKCSTPNGDGALALACRPNCDSFLRQEIGIVRPKVILVGTESLARIVREVCPTIPVVAFRVFRDAPPINDPSVTPSLARVAQALGRPLPPELDAVRDAIRHRYFRR